jgi:hypothetical protein
LDLLLPTFGFLAKLVCSVGMGGGVKAGSTCVTPPMVFLMNEVVSMNA